jgi:hypothetical protein
MPTPNGSFSSQPKEYTDMTISVRTFGSAAKGILLVNAGPSIRHP